MELEYFKISEEHERMIEELKYLLGIDPNFVKDELLHLLNKLNPFIQYPLQSPPPIELFEVDKYQPKIITEDLKQQLTSYCFIILRGSMVISRENYQFSEQKYLDEDNIKEKCVYNFNEGKSRMTALTNSVYIKIHNVWIKRAKKKSQQRQLNYIKKKLIEVNFFSNLTFEEFSKCCKKAYIKKLSSNQVLIKESQVPYHMYVVAEGELSLETKVKFSKKQKLWNEVRSMIKKNTDFCEDLFEDLVKQPQSEDPFFEVDFNLKQIHQGQIIGAKETLLEQPLQFSIKSTLSTKIICIKYPDLYVFKAQRLMEMRNWPYLCEINKSQLRRQYYCLMGWNEFKQFLKEQNKLAKVQKMKFDHYLRKDINLNSRRYQYFPQKVGEGKIVESPAAKALIIKDLSEIHTSQKTLSEIHETKD